MAGVTKEEIARAKELDLLTYFKLVEPSNLKLVGKEYRQGTQFADHQQRQPLVLALHRPARTHGAEVSDRRREGTLCRGSAGDQPHPRRRGSFFPTCKPAAATRRTGSTARFQAAQARRKQLCSYGVSARALYPPQCTGVLPQGGHFVPDQLQKSPELRICRARR